MGIPGSALRSDAVHRSRADPGYVVYARDALIGQTLDRRTLELMGGPMRLGEDAATPISACTPLTSALMAGDDGGRDPASVRVGTP